jgi:Ca2+:H+ antiporter
VLFILLFPIVNGSFDFIAQMASIEEETTGLQDEAININGSPLSVRKMQTFEHIGSLAAVAQNYGPRSAKSRILMSIYIVLIKAKINVLLPFGPLAVILHYVTGKHVRF